MSCNVRIRTHPLQPDVRLTEGITGIENNRDTRDGFFRHICHDVITLYGTCLHTLFRCNKFCNCQNAKSFLFLGKVRLVFLRCAYEIKDHVSFRLIPQRYNLLIQQNFNDLTRGIARQIIQLKS